ncbi:MAG: hypothetical protein JXO48_05475 [Deltaproteobacteria bacterium]|nr:hypothetical protein [Deltaproteobacteria bacterium]
MKHVLKMDTANIIVFFLVLCLFGCSTRQVVDTFSGSTEQRLLTHSIDKLMRSLPEKDFSSLTGESIFLETVFVLDSSVCAYATARLKKELEERYRCVIVDTPGEADRELFVFFTSLGTGNDKAGLSTPPLMVPGMGGTMAIDILALDMYHGVAELYYYLRDPATGTTTRGERVKAVIRTDSLATPVLTIPISTLP